MPADVVEDVLDTKVVGSSCEILFPVQDNPLEAFAEQRERRLFYFGCPGSKFEFTCIPPVEYSPGEGGDGAWVGEKVRSESSIGRAPTEEDESLSLSESESSGLSDSSWFSQSSLGPSDTHHPSTFSDNEQDLVYPNDCSKAMGFEKPTAIDVCQPAVAEQTIDPTMDDATSESLTTPEESAQASSAPAGWTYRQVLEVIAFPPTETPHLWYSKISQLAAQIGMPRGSTGRDIIAFVLRVAKARNEFEKVAQLVRSLVAAAKAAERQAIMSSMLVSLAPRVRSATPAEGTGSPETCSSSIRKRAYDELEVASDSESELFDELESSSDEDDAEETSHRTARRLKYTEEDLYCRIDDCLWAFDSPRTCLKHRRRHFPVQWLCPGPCKSKGGKFARDETLKRHLLFPNHVACREAVLTLLGLRSIPVSGTAWMTPLRDGPERPWESPGFRLTDLKTVKENKVKLCDSNSTDETPPPITRATRRRYK
ncbi:hypothetical protein BJV78DRAFT_82448 [Lactifluus subvellereus]|nr:hypothetical protein BJV78DRAFT_82448 [Lactifluus subvellereus]